jgi:methyl-accepting chemotaxis protein
VGEFMKISTKLYVAFGVILLIIVGFAIFAPIQMNSLSTSMERLKNENIKKIMLLNEIKENQNIIARAIRNMLLTDDEKTFEKEWNRVLEAQKNMGQLRNKLKEEAKSENEKKIINEISDLRDKYINGQMVIYNFGKQKQIKEATQFLTGEFRNIQSEYFKKVNDYLNEELRLIDQEISSGSSLANFSRTLLLIIGFFGVVFGVVFATLISKNISKPINKAAEASEKIARGNTNVDLESKSKDETAMLMNSMKRMVENLSSMVSDVKYLAKSAMEGKLDVRVDATKYEGDFKELIEGFNGTLDAIIGPLNVAAEYVDRISKGDIPPKITDEYKGDFNEIKNNINLLIDTTNKVANDILTLSKGNLNIDLKVRSENDVLIKSVLVIVESIKALVQDAATLADAAREGRLDIRADANKHQGDYRKIIQGINDSLDNIIGPLNVAAEYVDRISKGDIPPIITEEFKGDFNEIKNNLNQLINTMNSLIEDVNSFSTEFGKCRLSYRIDSTKHRGAFGKMLEGINQSIDVVGNIFDFAGNFMLADEQGIIAYLNDSQKKFLKKYEADYRKNYPDFDTDKVIGTNIDRWHKNPAYNRRLLSELTSTHEAKINIGDQVMRLVINPLFNKEGHKFGFVVQWVNYTNEANLENELNVTIDKLLNGVLDTRINNTKFTGSYIEIANNLNKMLDAIINPLNVTSNYIDRISKGDIPPKITDEYKGDFNEIKNNLNLLIDSIQSVVDDTLTIAKALAEGNLELRAEASKHQGVFREIVETINSAVDNIAGPLQETSMVMNFMSDGDLTVRILGEYVGELQKLKENINNMTDSITDLLLQVAGSADITASTAAELSAIAETLAASAAENSAQVDEIATAIEEMSRTISENAMGATRASEVAERSKQIASEGGQAVIQTVNKMKEIASVVRASADKIEKLGESSKQIGEIISVIDEIADQTNLLALNAAIEAARAGEQGRGFAVVADEVRKLAERTTEATKQIANMIKGIQKETEEAVRAMKQGTDEVNSGILLADQAGKALEEIMHSTQEVWDMINQIAAATEEQSSTAEQVAKNVSSISQVTADTANRVQDIAKSTEDLAKQTEVLRTLLERFKLQKETSSSHLEASDSRKLSGKGSRYLGSGSY